MDLIKKNEKLISTSEKKFIRSSNQANIRIDGRTSTDYREIKIDFLENWGNLILRIGKTKVLAQTIGEIVKPPIQRPSEGSIFFKIHLSEMASDSFHDRKKEEWNVEIERIIDRSIRGSRAIDLESLCIIAGEYVWKLNVKVTVLDYCGNLIDACQIATLMSLMHYRRNEITVNFNDEKNQMIVHDFANRHPKKLDFYHFPLCITFAFFDENNCCVDPNLEEELISKCSLTVALNTNKEICLLHKPGGIQIHFDVILKCCSVAAIKVEETQKVLLQLLEEDVKKKKKAKIPVFDFTNEFYNIDAFKKQNDIIISDDEEEIEETKIVGIFNFENTKDNNNNNNNDNIDTTQNINNAKKKEKEKKKRRKKKKKRIKNVVDLSSSIINKK